MRGASELHRYHTQTVNTRADTSGAESLDRYTQCGCDLAVMVDIKDLSGLNLKLQQLPSPLLSNVKTCKEKLKLRQLERGNAVPVPARQEQKLQ